MTDETLKAQFAASWLGYIFSIFCLIGVIQENNVPNNLYLIFGSCIAVITAIYGAVFFLVGSNSAELAEKFKPAEALAYFMMVFIWGLNLMVHIDFFVHFIVIYFSELFF